LLSGIRIERSDERSVVVESSFAAHSYKRGEMQTFLRFLRARAPQERGRLTIARKKIVLVNDVGSRPCSTSTALTQSLPRAFYLDVYDDRNLQTKAERGGVEVVFDLPSQGERRRDPYPCRCPGSCGTDLHVYHWVPWARRR